MTADLMTTAAAIADKIQLSWEGTACATSLTGHEAEQARQHALDAWEKEARSGAELPVEQIAAVRTLVAVREAGVEKWGEQSWTMLLTRDLLEQATRSSIAAFHAEQFAAMGVTTVIEAGCGAGGDTLAFAEAGLEVEAWEIDETSAACARANLAAYPRVRMVCGDALARVKEIYDDAAGGVISTQAVFVDPQRRSGGRRLTNPEQWKPPFSTVQQWGSRLTVGAKIAPGIPLELLGVGETVWVSEDRDLVECSVWMGPHAPHRFRARMSCSGTVCEFTGPARQVHERVEPAVEIGDVLALPDPAAIRAGAIPYLCERFDLAPVGEGISFLTGTGGALGAERDRGKGLEEENAELGSLSGPAHEVLRWWRVEAVLPVRAKKIAAYFRDHPVGSVEVLARGVDVQPAVIRDAAMKAGGVVNKSLKKSSEGMSIIVTKSTHGARAIVARVG